MDNVVNNICYTGNIDGITHVYFGFYPSYFVMNNRPEMIPGDHNLIINNINDFKNGIGQETAIELVKIQINNLVLQNPNLDKRSVVFVCLPASQQAKNEIRFKSFSHSVCSELKIQNGFNHINIFKGKDEKHLKGAARPDWDMESDLRFDDGFFAGKKVILFDDIVTSGDTMRSFIYKFINLGAKPVLCMSLLYTPRVY